MNKKQNISRRGFLKYIGAGAALSAIGCMPSKTDEKSGQSTVVAGSGEMTYRINNTTGDRVSILGYGCMRLPTYKQGDRPELVGEIDQDAVNRSVDYAIEHGVNYFDTSPAYCKGKSERSMGIALSRHPRDSYYIATKLSNFGPDSWPREQSIAMYKNSFKELQVNYIDYMLLHGIGMGGMSAYNGRYVDNGMLDFLKEEQKAGRIRNLGFSYHGDVKVFDYLLSLQDEGLIRWNFAQIQLNYVDWKHAKEINPNNTNAEYLYAELDKREIPVVIMEPLLGGQLANVNKHTMEQFKRRRPQDSVASWAFRFAGTPERVLTVLSGMTYMEHLKDNLRTYSPLEPCTEAELALLEASAKLYVNYPTVPCTDCKYCMPCPYGLDIPAIFAHYNKCVNEGKVAEDAQDPNYREARRAFLIGYDRKVPRLRQASHCIRCGKCKSHCPQGIDIPRRLSDIDKFVENLKQNTL